MPSDCFSLLMFVPPLAALSHILRELGYAVPLVVTVSLVYAATRHELMPAILRHAGRVGTMILLFFSLIFVALQFVAARL